MSLKLLSMVLISGLNVRLKSGFSWSRSTTAFSDDLFEFLSYSSICDLTIAVVRSNSCFLAFFFDSKLCLLSIKIISCCGF